MLFLNARIFWPHGFYAFLFLTATNETCRCLLMGHGGSGFCGVVVLLTCWVDVGQGEASVSFGCVLCQWCHILNFEADHEDGEGWVNLPN